MTNVKIQIPNECQMTNAKKRRSAVIQIYDILVFRQWKQNRVLRDHIGKCFDIGILDFI
jgi:hypothetical protein